MHFVGFDAGSVTVKAVVLDGRGKQLEGHYVRHSGHPLRAALTLLRDIDSRYPKSSLSITGSAGKIIASILNIKPINEIVSQSYSVRKLHPEIGTIIELGGEDSKLILLEHGRIKGFSMNSVCAAGTGSFLEQQAERLRFSIEDFSETAAKSLRPSKIAGRCSVFAKSDMIHLQQIATPVEDIVAGLCFAVARNFKGSIAQGIDIKPPVSFQGGVAANKGMVRAFKEVFALDDLFVPPDFALMGAIGAALKDIDEGNLNTFDLGKLDAFLTDSQNSEQGYAPLISEGDDFFVRHSKNGKGTAITRQSSAEKQNSDKITAYLGIDIGSISTNLAIIDETGKLLAKRYLMTAGRPIEAVRQGLREIYEEVGDLIDVKGVGTTGSGRYMIADYVGADIVKNEITAQATAAIFIDPTVDTIFEIGGQDSKYISIRDGIIVDFEMNKACAAGTGSFLEEQADKLDISVKGEFAEAAFRSDNPCRLGERCTVFMENSLMANLQRGHAKDDLLAGLSYSIVQNYINRVVAGKPVGKNIFFQGGVAFNKAVVAAFEKYVGAKVTVPANHDVTGAIGMALLAMKHMKHIAEAHHDTPTLTQTAQTAFKGLELSQRPYEIDSFECKGCPNVCEINRVKVLGDSDHLFYGGRCEKYDIRLKKKPSVSDPFSFREEILWKEHNRRAEERKGRSKAKLGLPYIFFLHDLLPFWSTLLWELGFEVIVSPRTNKQIINLGVENVLSEACFPVKVSHGHVKYLKDLGVDALFVPSFININNESNEYTRGLSCPHTQTIPYITRAAIGGLKMLTPIIDFERGEKYIKKEIRRSLAEYKISSADIDRAFAAAKLAQAEFRREIKGMGKTIVADYLNAEKGSVPKQPLIVIIGRAYNAYDPGVNLGIPKKLSHIDVLSIPMDFLLLEEESLEDSWPNMYWRSGQRILKAARIIRNNPNLYAIYIGNFSCGPDSFILKYFKEEMGDKPFLHIEIDEHSADAGAITRCEAFLDSIEQQRSNNGNGKVYYEKALTLNPASALPRFSATSLAKRTIYLPSMCAHSFAIRAAFEACGINSEMLPDSDRESVDIGRRYVSGKECYPYIITAGDMLKKVLSADFRPERSAFFMPSGSGPCRFGQYNVSHKLILNKLGFGDVPIFSPNQDTEFYRQLSVVGSDFSMAAWKGIVAYELLTKCLHETRPYEKSKGDAESLYAIFHEGIDRTVAGNGNMVRLLAEMKDSFASVPRNNEKRPVIGLVGEIFVRSHKFSNEELIKKIEALGGEVRLASMEEWIYYVNDMALRKALIKKDKSDIMNIFAKRFFQKRIEHKYARPFKDLLNSLGEPNTKVILENAAPYVHNSFEGETVLSIGKAIDLIEKGAAGIINAMPFGCMPGTIVTALLKKLAKDFRIPCISIPYDGSESPTTGLQLEAFMESVRTDKIQGN